MIPARRTKIVATLGPASDSPEQLRALVAAGMDAARLNLSHGTHEDHAERARRVREVEAEAGRPIALIADLQGPKLRVGELVEPVVLTRRRERSRSARRRAASDGELPVAPAVIGDVLKPGHDVLIDDGLVRLRVDEVEHGRARCAVIVGGTVTSHKGVNLPGVPLPIPSLTRKDIADLEFALELGVDFVALSFVRSPADVRDLRALIEQAGSHAHVIAKIEKSEAVDVLDDILAETDAVMVARGDLGVEIGPALVPLMQKRIILKALERGKPVITATQMLESMVHSSRADAGRGERRRERDPRRNVGGDAVGRDRGRRVPGRGGGVHGPHRARDRAEHGRTATRFPSCRAEPDDRRRDVECGVRHRRGAARGSDSRADVPRQDCIERRAAAAAPADHRGHAHRLGDGGRWRSSGASRRS